MTANFDTCAKVPAKGAFAVEILQQLGLQPGMLDGKVAVVTGAARGIGRETARALAWLGANVVIADISDGGRETEAMIRAAGGTALFYQTDVASEAGVARLAMWTLADFGPADILVNGAILCPIQTVLEMTPDVFDQTLAVNLRGPYLTCRAFVPGMLEKKGGTIINMISTDAMVAMSAYMASKQGLKGFTQSLAAEVSHLGIRAVAFAPGFVDTPGLRAAGEALAPRLGMKPAEHSGAATAYLILKLADEYHGEAVDVYKVLERAGFLKDDVAGAVVAPLASVDAVALSGQLEAILAEVEAELGKLPIFVRPLARSGFKNKAGQSVGDWIHTAAELTRRLAAGEAVDGEASCRKLEQLITYCAGVPAETARFTKDAEFLREVHATSAARVAALRALCAALASH